MEDMIPLAEQFVDHLAAGRIMAAHALLDVDTQATGAAVKLQDLWRRMNTKYGRLLRRSVVASHPSPQGAVVYFVCEFQRSTLPTYAVCTPGRRIMAFGFGYPEQVKYLHMLRTPEDS